MSARANWPAGSYHGLAEEIDVQHAGATLRCIVDFDDDSGFHVAYVRLGAWVNPWEFFSRDAMDAMNERLGVDMREVA